MFSSIILYYRLFYLLVYLSRLPVCLVIYNLRPSTSAPSLVVTQTRDSVPWRTGTTAVHVPFASCFFLLSERFFGMFCARGLLIVRRFQGIEFL